jgi:uncharacterized protein YvpB
MVEKILKIIKVKKYLPIKIFVPALFLAIFATLFIARTALAISPSLIETDHPIDQPLVVNINQTLRYVDLEQIEISPNIDGEWSFRSGGLFGSGELVFNHDKDFIINTEYKVEFGTVKRYLFGDQNLPDVSFKTQAAPNLANQGLAKLKDGAVIAADYTFAASLQFANHHLRDLVIKAEPATEMQSEIKNDRDYTWRPVDLLPQGQDVAVEVYDTKNQVSLLKKTLHVADEPSIKTMVHADHFGQDETAKLEFNQPITPESRDEIVFDFAGEGKWESDTVYAFKPETVAAGKTYTYHIKAGLRSQAGGILTHDIDGSFATVGAVAVTSSSPRGKELSQGQQQIKFTFDQAVDHQSAQQRFTVSSGNVAGFSWSGNTMTATVKNLGFQRTVTATVAAGVANAGFGLPSNQPFSVSFTTEIRTIKLGVPMLRQQHSATCVVATIRMALAYYGVGAEEMDIVNRMGYNPRPMDTATNTWDDPAQMFVGDVNGTDNYTAGGAEVTIAARIVGSYGRGSATRTGGGVNVNWIAEEIHAGHPVIISGTGVKSKPTYYSWTTPGGRTVQAASNGHARIVFGVRGEPGAPLTFYINDPTNGVLTWSAAQLAGNLRTNPYGGMAVAVY